MSRNQSILHVDDDPAILHLVAERLKKEGYDVTSLDDPTQTSMKLLETGARLVILDIDMPQIDGLTLLKNLKEYDGGVHVIMLTGLVSMSTVLQSMQWGAEACVFKPLANFDRLLAATRTAFCKIDNWWDALHELQYRSLEQEQNIEEAVS